MLYVFGKDEVWALFVQTAGKREYEIAKGITVCIGKVIFKTESRLGHTSGGAGSQNFSRNLSGKKVIGDKYFLFRDGPSNVHCTCIALELGPDMFCPGMGHEHFWTSGTDQAEEGKLVTNLIIIKIFEL